MIATDERDDAEGGESGTAYLVATPIGNLEDVTFRALTTLRSVDLVLAEDTRRTRKLLSHHDIRAPLAAYHEHNEKRKTPEMIDRLRSGQDLALVTDAGTPTISDPGYRLVREAVEAGIRVVPVPGPSAVLAALTASGLPTDRFTFLGYLPRTSGARRSTLASVRHLPGTLVYLESPRRLLASLQDAAEILGGRDAAVARELTKVHEEYLRGTLDELAAALGADDTADDERQAVRGEVTVCVAGHPDPGPPPGSGADARLQLSVPQHYTTLRRAGVPRKEALRQVARERGISRRDVYQEVMVEGAGSAEDESTGAEGASAPPDEPSESSPGEES